MIHVTASISGANDTRASLAQPHTDNQQCWNFHRPTPNRLDGKEQKENIVLIEGETWNFRIPPYLIHRVSTACQAVHPRSKGSVSMSMVSLLASLVMVGAGCVAFAAIAVTVRAQLPAVRKLLAESRALAADREFLVEITTTSMPAPPRMPVRTRRATVRLVKSAQASTESRWRAAA